MAGILKMFVDAGLAFEAGAMGGNVGPLGAHLGRLVLALRHHHRHVGLFHPQQARPQRVGLGSGRALQAAAQVGDLLVPRRSHFVVQAYRGRLVDRDHHALAEESPVGKVADEIPSDFFETVVASDQMVLPRELALEAFFLGGIEFGLLEQALEIFLEMLIGKLQFGDAVLVVQLDRRAFVDRALEVVHADIIAEDLSRALLPGEQGGAGEGEEGGVGQGGAHVHRQGVVLAAVGFVGQDEDVVALADDLVQLALGCAKFVDQGENISVVLAQQSAQVGAALGLGVFLGDDSGAGEGAIDLVVEIEPIGDHHEGPIAGNFAQGFLGEEHHREAFAAALGMPEDAEAAVFFDFSIAAQIAQGLLDAEILMVLGNDLLGALAAVVEEDVIFDQVEQALGRADGAEIGFEIGGAGFGFAVDSDPRGEVVPGGGEAADSGGEAVREDHQAVEVEEVGDLSEVALEVSVVAAFGTFFGCLELEKEDGETVDEGEDVGVSGGVGAADGELADRSEGIIFGVVPIDELDIFGAIVRGFRVSEIDFDAIFEPFEGFAVGLGSAGGGAVFEEEVSGGFEGLGGEVGVEAVEGGGEIVAEEGFGF